MLEIHIEFGLNLCESTIYQHHFHIRMKKSASLFASKQKRKHFLTLCFRSSILVAVPLLYFISTVYFNGNANDLVRGKSTRPKTSSTWNEWCRFLSHFESSSALFFRNTYLAYGNVTFLSSFLKCFENIYGVHLHFVRKENSGIIFSFCFHDIVWN